MGSGHLNSGSQAFVANVLSTESSAQPQEKSCFFFFLMLLFPTLLYTHMISIAFNFKGRSDDLVVPRSHTTAAAFVLLSLFRLGIPP